MANYGIPCQVKQLQLIFIRQNKIINNRLFFYSRNSPVANYPLFISIGRIARVTVHYGFILNIF